MLPRSLILAAICIVGSAQAGEAPTPVLPGVDAILAAAPLPGGLLVHAGATDAAWAIAQAKAAPWVCAILAHDAAAAAGLRSAVDAAGLSGQITVLSGLAAQGLPFAANSVGVLAIESGWQAPAAERQRVLRPDGVLLEGGAGGWRRAGKPRPEGMDVWSHWHGAHDQNDGNNDTLVGPPRGLQWTSGSSVSNHLGFRISGQVAVSVVGGGVRAPTRVVGRDAFSGVQLWAQEMEVTSQYAVALDDRRLFLLRDSDQQVPMESFDLRTGKPLGRFDQGMKARKLEYSGRANTGPQVRQWPVPQALVDDGVLVQRFGQTLHALDAATGALLWKAELGGDELFGYIASSAGLVVACEGVGSGTANGYIPNFSRMGLSRLVARDLRTGRQAWTWAWSGPKRPNTPEICHLAIGPDQVGVAAVQRSGPDDKAPNGEPTRGWGFLVNLDLKTGKQHWFYQHQERYTAGWMGLGLQGHSYFRTYFHSGRQWMVEFSRPRPYDPEKGALVKDGEPYSYNFRCHPGRTTADLAIGSLFVGSFKDPDLAFFSEAGRSPCDVGTFPANGLLYQAANSCPCHAWLVNDNAYSCEPTPKPITAERLERGPAKPAPSPSGTWPAADAWPMHLRDSQRSSWVETKLAAQPAIAWTVKPAIPSTPQAQIASEWRTMIAASGQLGTPSHAEGVIVVPAIHQQALIALDPQSGRERWRARLEGRIDSAPTIYKGLVLCGTHAGWIYALNRDDGTLVWRFLAAPAGRNIVANGQIASAWPLYGTISIVDDTLWVNAGRHLATDEGIWWWGLDPLTGAVRKQFQTGFGGDWQKVSQMPTRDERGRQRPDNTFGRAGGNANLPLVSDGKRLFVQGFGVDPATGQRIPAATRSGYEEGQPIYAQPGMYGFVWGGDHIPNGQQGAAAWFGTMPAKAFAWKDRRAVGIAFKTPFTGGRPAWEGGPNYGLIEVPKTRDAKTGWTTPVWSRTLPGNGRDVDRARQADGVAVAGDTVVLLYGDAMIGARLADGEPQWTITLPQGAINGGLAVAAGQITVVCEDGSVVGIR
jgi:outer membrane protein assembly factor BamB